MKLVLAEKPSVAQSIAKVLGATGREEGYFRDNGYIVSWCVGQLVELAQSTCMISHQAYDSGTWWQSFSPGNLRNTY